MEDPVTGKGRDGGRLFVLPGPEELARAAAGRLWGIVRERSAALSRTGGKNQPIRVALSGGDTPRRALALLAGEPYRGGFPWESVHFYQVDERWVPSGDPRSNRGMLEAQLFSRAPVPPGNVHLVDTSLSGPEEGARRYEETLRASFGSPPGGYPRFDAILLGIGKDGHTASIFPGAPEPPPGRWAAAVEGGDPPLPRVTLTLPVLCAAARIVYLASGREKEEAVRGVLAGDMRLPAARVVPGRGAVVILADEAAAPRPAGERRETR